jgi:hypothetical protein
MVTDGNGIGYVKLFMNTKKKEASLSLTCLDARYLYESYGHGALGCLDGATGPTNACRVGLRGL